MSSRWRDLPSLSALRAFDATARHGGFAGAGRALNVTHAAVTQQVRALEAEIGVQLVRRSGRTVSLTPAGERLAQVLGEAFGGMSAGIENLRRSEERRILRVTTTTFVAEQTIMPRLPEFWALHPEVEVALVPTPSVVDLIEEGFDLAVRVHAADAPPPPGTEVHPLCHTPILAVCAPELLKDGPFDPQDLPWITSDHGWPWDRENLSKAGFDTSRLKRVQLGSPHLEMSAARQGLGISLATEIICRPDLEAGRLVALPILGLPSVDYVVILPRGPRRPAVDHFASWLRTVFA